MSAAVYDFPAGRVVREARSIHEGHSPRAATLLRNLQALQTVNPEAFDCLERIVGDRLAEDFDLEDGA